MALVARRTLRSLGEGGLIGWLRRTSILNMDLVKIKKQAFEGLEKVKTPVDLEQFRIKYLGRKGEITAILRSLKDLPVSKRKKLGLEANKLKSDLEQAFEKKKKSTRSPKATYGMPSGIDVTAPGIKLPQGHLHPLTLIMRKIEEIFLSMGFKIVQGPDIETEYYNFDALNIPKDHPARDVWDTFWLKTKGERLLLRTHTSPMQIKYMEKNNPPLRIIVPGRCFRYEATDASHSHTFYQLEGLMVDRNITIANFKAIIEEFLKKMFGQDIEMRVRPGYFPFTEPSFEADMRSPSGKWVEIMGAGMVHPNVFKSAGYVPSNWQGFAFGMGIDRITMLKYKINDIRLLYSGDLRFLKQF
jgi:phenylalanyl-tRNA synthetase alpha chain